MKDVSTSLLWNSLFKRLKYLLSRLSRLKVTPPPFYPPPPEERGVLQLKSTSEDPIKPDIGEVGSNALIWHQVVYTVPVK
jgi:hypothetical protein